MFAVCWQLCPYALGMGYFSQNGARLSPEDLAIWQTIQVNHALENGQLEAVPRQQATIRMPDGRGPLASGPFQTKRLMDVQVEAQRVDPRRTGMYNHVSFSNGRAVARSVGYQVGTAVVANMANRRNERRANARSGWQWVDDDSGELFLSSVGVILRGRGETQQWAWRDIQNAELVGMHAIRVETRGLRGASETYALASPYAEMLFVLWAHQEFPDHAQLSGRVWIPRGWHERMARGGFSLPPGA